MKRGWEVSGSDQNIKYCTVSLKMDAIIAIKRAFSEILSPIDHFQPSNLPAGPLPPASAASTQRRNWCCWNRERNGAWCLSRQTHSPHSPHSNEEYNELKQKKHPKVRAGIADLSTDTFVLFCSWFCTGVARHWHLAYRSFTTASVWILASKSGPSQDRNPQFYQTLKVSWPRFFACRRDANNSIDPNM